MNEQAREIQRLKAENKRLLKLLNSAAPTGKCPACAGEMSKGGCAQKRGACGEVRLFSTMESGTEINFFPTLPHIETYGDMNHAFSIIFNGGELTACWRRRADGGWEELNLG